MLAINIFDITHFEAAAGIICSAGASLQHLQLIISEEPPDGPLSRRCWLPQSACMLCTCVACLIVKKISAVPSFWQALAGSTGLQSLHIAFRSRLCKPSKLR